MNEQVARTAIHRPGCKTDLSLSRVKADAARW